MRSINRLVAFAVLTLLVIISSPHAAQRLVLIETQTNTNCIDCPNADLVLDQLVHYYQDYFVPVVYHTWWPSAQDPFYCYNSIEDSLRIVYYPPHYDGFYHTPYAWIDGFIRGGVAYGSWWSLIQNRHSQEAPLQIDLSGQFDESQRIGFLEVAVTAIENIYWQDLKIRIALTEDSLYYEASNGRFWHNYTMRDMIPSQTGIPITIAQGDSLVHTQNFTCPEPLNPEFCRLVVWVQADENREVLQVARISISELGPVSINDDNKLPGRLALGQNFPNPFNTTTVIHYFIDVECRVKLAVYDLTGRQIVTLFNGVQVPGYQQAVWNGLDSKGNSVSSGIYFYRMTADGVNITKRMVVLK